MSLHSLDVQKAVYDALKAALGPLNVAVYDTAPQDAPFPFVEFAEQQALPINKDTTLATELAEHRVYLAVWSAYRGKAEVQRINGVIYDTMHGAKPTLAAGTAIACHVTSAECRKDGDGVTHQGAVTIRILVQN